jgi:hypothetical protein
MRISDLKNRDFGEIDAELDENSQKTSEKREKWREKRLKRRKLETKNVIVRPIQGKVQPL